MILTHLALTGFRGFRERLDIECPDGFVVVSGRNGTGKSTICDAIEYALAGRLQRFREKTERGESMHDYVWWRGPGSPQAGDVRLTMMTAAGATVSVERRRDGGASHRADELRDLLCGGTNVPADALDTLLLLCIMRDETIAEHSVELSETERFAFIQRVVGTSALRRVRVRTEDTLKGLAGHKDALLVEYRSARDRVADSLARLQEARATQISPGAFVDALHTLGTIVGVPDATPDQVLPPARELLAQERARHTRLRSLAAEGGALLERSSAQKEDVAARAGQERAARLQELTAELAAVRLRREDVDRTLAAISARTSERALLAELAQSGQQLGLRDGKCPLCGSLVVATAFEAHIASVRSLLGDVENEMRSALDQRQLLSQRAAELESEAATADLAIRRAAAAIESTREFRDQLHKEARALGVTVADESDDSAFVVAVSITLGAVQEALSRLDGTFAIVEAHRPPDGTIALEEEANVLGSEADALEKRLQRAEAAESLMKGALQTVKRTENELVEEQLAAIRPTLEELYSRLQPHPEWRAIRYAIRGDVRRFLRLSIGDDVNPTFLFSSGQRRALGLAFLFAAYLGATWSRFRSIIVDDPVQHIDDYRALHVAEVLGALCRTGRQVVCTVEDPELAQLLCRRLLVAGGRGGIHVELKYEVGSGCSVGRIQEYVPADQRILRSG